MFDLSDTGKISLAVTVIDTPDLCISIETSCLERLSFWQEVFWNSFALIILAMLRLDLGKQSKTVLILERGDWVDHEEWGYFNLNKDERWSDDPMMERLWPLAVAMT